MINFEINKAEFHKWLNKRENEYQVLVPVKNGQEFNWGYWDSKTLPDSTYQNTLKPPKDLFFPQHEVLLKYQKEKGKKPIIEEPDLPNENRIIFGMRPCDAKSLVILDKVFLSEEYQDPFYKARRDNTIIISLVCQEPGLGCFCSNPFSKDGTDIMLVELGEKYLVELVTAKGEQAFQDAVSSVINSSVNKELEDLVDKLNQEIASTELTEELEIIFEDTLWEELQEKCLNCGACSFLCPTCHCFDLTDDQQGQKIRSWDSCMFSSFTKQASGHNPRPSGTERLRQRVMHKFKYFPEKYGILACVGCGRCVEKCPVNLDLRQVLLRIRGVL